MIYFLLHNNDMYDYWNKLAPGFSLYLFVLFVFLFVDYLGNSCVYLYLQTTDQIEHSLVVCLCVCAYRFVYPGT